MRQSSEEKNNQMHQPDFVWPLSGTAVADNMNTSYGPRIKECDWDFHHGQDHPAAPGENVYAIHSGKIYRAGPRDDIYKSRHVVLKVKEKSNATKTRSLYIVYLHLRKISEGIKPGIIVKRGKKIGEVGSAFKCTL